MKKGENYNILKGKRLCECRKLRNLTQQELAEKVEKSTNYISMIETGKRELSYKFAKSCATELNVSINYLMLESNNITEKKLHHTPDEYLDREYTLVKLFELLGHDVKFRVVELNDGKQPPKKYIDFYKKEVELWDRLERTVSIDDLEDISLYDGKCKLKKGKTKSESVIVKVIIDNQILTTGEFVFFSFELQNYIDFMLDNISRNKTFYEVYKLTDKVTDEIVKTSRNTPLQNEKFQNLLRKKKNQSDNPITQEELKDIFGQDSL